MMILLSVMQISFISGLPFQMSNLNLILVILVLMLGFGDLYFVMWWSFGLGLVLDVFSFLPFGTHLIALPIAVYIAYFLLNNFFTNRSLYTFLALGAISTLVYELFLQLTNFLLNINNGDFSFVKSSSFWMIKLSQLEFNLLAMLIFFNLLHFLSKRLKPVFLIKKN